MKKGIVAFLACMAIAVSCADRDDELMTANIRIRNNTAVDFNLVEVIQDSLFYENVSADGFSDYISFEEAFPQMPLTIVTDSTTFNYTVNDSLQELLPVGLYTYEIDFTDNGAVQLTFKVD